MICDADHIMAPWGVAFCDGVVVTNLTLIAVLKYIHLKAIAAAIPLISQWSLTARGYERDARGGDVALIDAFAGNRSGQFMLSKKEPSFITLTFNRPKIKRA